MVVDQSLCKKISFFRNTISHCAHHNEHGGEKSMTKKNDSSQPTDANYVRRKNQQSAQNAQNASSQGSNNFNTEFGSEFAPNTNANQVRKQNQQSAQNAQNASSQGSNNSNSSR